MTKAKPTRGIGTPRCPDTVDLEELLEWMVLNPVSHPDNGLLYDTTRADEPPVTPRPWREELKEITEKDRGSTMLAWRQTKHRTVQ